MGPRQYLTDALKAALGTSWKVYPWDANVTFSGPTVLFYRTQVRPVPEAPNGSWEHEVTLHVGTAKQVGEEALDSLDVALDEVLVALHGIPNTTWTTATYETFNDFPAFVVKVQIPSKIAPTQE